MKRRKKILSRRSKCSNEGPLGRLWERRKGECKWLWVCICAGRWHGDRICWTASPAQSAESHLQAVNWMNLGGVGDAHHEKNASRGLKSSGDEGRAKRETQSWASMTMSMDGEDPLLEMSYAGIGDLGHVATASVRALTCTDVLQPRCTRLAYTPRVSFVYTLSQIAPA